MSVKFFHRRRNLCELELVARVRYVITVYDVVLITKD